MTIIKMEGWRPGLQKVSLTQALQRVGLGLRDAKTCTDRLLAGNVAEVSVAENDSAAVLEILRRLGVDARAAEAPPNKPMQTDGPSGRR